MNQMPKNPRQNNFWQGVKGAVAVAHRGGDGAGIEKENSMAAFEAAHRMGYRWFETDVVPTKDGRLLAIHGRGYQRAPNKDLPLRTALQRQTYEELLRTVSIGGEPPLLLEDLIDSFPDVKIFIDPKTYKAAPILAKLLARRPQDIERIWVGSFLPFNTGRVVREVRRLTGVSEVGTALLGPLRASPLRAAVLLPRLGPLIRSYVQWTGAGSVHVPYRWVAGSSGKKLVNFAHEAGLRVGVYTPNTAQDIKASASAGADIIMSDKLSLLKNIVGSRY